MSLRGVAPWLREPRTLRPMSGFGRFGVGFRLLIRGRRMSSTAGLWAVDWAFSGSHARGCRAQVLPCNITHTKVLILYRSPKVFTKKTGGLCMK